MQALAGYTGWKFEYVKCDWSNCFDKSENGHIAKPIQVDKLLSIRWLHHIKTLFTLKSAVIEEKTRYHASNKSKFGGYWK